jgi:hypothetical protein
VTQLGSRGRHEDTKTLHCMNEPYIFVSGVRSTMSQLIRIRAGLASGAGSSTYVATETYSCDTIEGLDRVLSDIRARRIDEIRITEPRLGKRRLVINYFGV